MSLLLKELFSKGGMDNNDSEYVLGPSGHKLEEGFDASELEPPIMADQELTRQSLLGCQPLTHLKVADEYLLDHAVWNCHKNTLVSLKTRPSTHQVYSLCQSIIDQLYTSPLLIHLSIEVIQNFLVRVWRGQSIYYGSSIIFGSDLISNLIHIEHLELLLRHDEPTFDHCRIL